MKRDFVELHLAILESQLRIEEAKHKILTSRPPTLELDLYHVTKKAIEKEIETVQEEIERKESLNFDL
jgi:hypothetical protein